MEFKQYLAELLEKHPTAITETERAFLTARSSYLTAEQLTAFGIIESETPEVVTVEAKEKKSKKTAEEAE